MIENIVAAAKRIADGRHDIVRPGQPVTISEAAGVGDYGWQGDLGVYITEDSPPAGWTRVSGVRQLAPGTTQGSRHCLASGATCEVWIHEDWGPQYDGLEGPWLRCRQETRIVHPVHGDVTIPAGMCVQIRYQREWDAEQARERRNAD